MFKSLMSEGGFSLDPLSVPWQNLPTTLDGDRMHVTQQMWGTLLNTFEYPKFAWKALHTNCRGWWWCNSGWIRLVFKNLVVVLIHLLDTLPFLSLWSSQVSCSQQACQWDHGFERKSQWLHLMFSRAATSIPPTTYSVLTMVVIPVLEKHQSISIAYWSRPTSGWVATTST